MRVRVRDSGAEADALRPLWLLASGAACGAAASSLASSPGPPWLRLALLATGAVAFAAALRRDRLARNALWLLAGLALAHASRALEQAGATGDAADLLAALGRSYPRHPLHTIGVQRLEPLPGPPAGPEGEHE